MFFITYGNNFQEYMWKSTQRLELSKKYMDEVEFREKIFEQINFSEKTFCRFRHFETKVDDINFKCSQQ